MELVLASEGHQGAHEVGGRAQVGCPHLVATQTSTPILYIHISEQKNQGERIIAIYETEQPPPPILHREARSGVRLGLRRGGFVAVVIINHPPSPIS